MLTCEQLESRNTPGGDLLQASLPVWVGMVQKVPSPPPYEPIQIPVVDLVVISAGRLGKPSRYLDLAHDALWYSAKVSDVADVYSMTAEINGVYAKKQAPITVVVVATPADGGNGVYIGRDGMWANSDTTKMLSANCGGQVKSMTWLVSQAKPKSQLYQAVVDGLRRESPVTLTSYDGHMRVGGGPPVVFWTNGPEMTWTSGKGDGGSG
jgi:hypothetical protein